MSNMTLKSIISGSTSMQQASAQMPSQTGNLVLDAYITIISSFCIPDEDAIAANMVVADREFSDDERIVSLESLSFVADNASLFFGMFVLNYKGFRDVVAQAVESELGLDSMNPIERRKSRAQMNSNGSVPIGHFVEIGISTFSMSVVSVLIDTAKSSFVKYQNTSFAKDVDALGKTMTDGEKRDIGAILSNYMFLLRALNHNVSFFSTMKDFVNDVKLAYQF